MSKLESLIADIKRILVAAGIDEMEASITAEEAAYSQLFLAR